MPACILPYIHTHTSVCIRIYACIYVRMDVLTTRALEDGLRLSHARRRASCSPA